MSVSEFTFAITLTSRDAFGGVLGEVAATVFRQLGCGTAAAASLLEELNAAVGQRKGEADTFDVQFLGREGHCDVVLLVRGREIWRGSRGIP